MLYAWLVILILLNTFWLLLTPLALPGNWLMVISTCLFAGWRWDEHIFSGGTLIAIALLALLGELIEFVAGMAGARHAGASWRASIRAIIGAIFGAFLGAFLIPIPLLGSVLGASFGAGLTVWATEIASGQLADHSLRRALGAGLGQFFGTLSKMAIGVVIWITITVAAFWP